MLSIPIIAQVVGWIGTIVNTLSFQTKNTIHMILMQALAGLIAMASVAVSFWRYGFAALDA